jgi:chorismate-pyruvate lyase
MPKANSDPSLALVAETTSFWYPLDYCYQRQNMILPKIEQVEPDQIPEPFKSLVVHQKDMTPTLERFHGDQIYIEVLHRDYSDLHYFREVVLKLEKSHQPVEFGAIRIFLERLPKDAREAILKEHIPLGHILEVFKVEHTSSPIGYLRMQPDPLIKKSFGDSKSRWLYGRRNRLSNPAGESLAEIIEILPESQIGA